MPCPCSVTYISKNLMKVNGRTNNALFIFFIFYFLTLDTNDTHLKLKEPKKHNRQILETNIVFSLFFYFLFFFKYKYILSYF